MVTNIDGARESKIKIRNLPRHGTQCAIKHPPNKPCNRDGSDVKMRISEDADSYANTRACEYI